MTYDPTTTEFHVAIKHVPALSVLTAQEVEDAIKGALVTKIGWSNTHQAINNGDLKVLVS